jgi:hypothetical protein
MNTATATKQISHYVVTENYDFGHETTKKHIVESLEEARALINMAGSHEDGVSVSIVAVFTDGTYGRA